MMFVEGDPVWVNDPAMGWKPGHVYSVVDETMVIDGPHVDSRIVQWTIGPEAMHLVTRRYESIGGTILLLESLTARMRDAVREGRMVEAIRLAEESEKVAEQVDARMTLAQQAAGLR